MIHRWLKADEVTTDDVGWAANLAIFRLVYLYAAILPIISHMLRWTSETMPLLAYDAWQPISFYRWLPDDVLRNAGLAHGLAVADWCLIVLGLIGFYTRSSLGLATVLSLYLFGLPQNFGKIDHTHHDIWFLAMLAAGPSGEMLSIDALIGAIRRADRGKVDLQVSKHTALATLRYVWLLMGVLYLSSGLGKLVAAWRTHWLDSANLANIIRRRWIVQRLYQRQFSPGFRYDKLPPALIQLGGLGTIAFETSAAGLVLFRGSRWLVILCGLAFHLSNGIILGIWFTSLMIAYVSMVDWAWLGRAAMRRVGRTPVTVIYDDSCKLCRRAIAILKTLDSCERLTPLAAASSDSFRMTYPQITSEMLARDLYVAGNGEVVAGYEAYRTIAACVPLLWPLALLMRLPPVAAMGGAFYRRIADNRQCRVAQDHGRPLVSMPAMKNTPALAAHLIGGLLLAAEATTATLNSGHGLAVFRILGMRSSTASVAGWKKQKWVWPFDRYPTFAYSWDLGSYRTWEPRLVYADGSESTIPPQVFARSFGNSLSVAEANVQQAVDYAHPEWRRKHALILAGMLWKNLPNSVRPRVIAINGYESVFSTNPDNPEPTSRTLIDTFPLQLLEAQTATNEGSRSRKPIRR